MILLIAAAVSFGLAAFRVPARVDFTNLGFMLVTLHVIAPHI